MLLAAGMAGILLYAWADGRWSESSHLEGAVEARLQELQKQAHASGPAASRQRMAAVEAELALKSSTPAEARSRSRQEMQRWLDQRAAGGSRE